MSYAVVRSHKEYLICKERGHGSTSHVLTSNPPWNVCSKCGTAWREETNLMEMDVPLPRGGSNVEVDTG